MEASSGKEPRGDVGNGQWPLQQGYGDVSPSDLLLGTDNAFRLVRIFV